MKHILTALVLMASMVCHAQRQLEILHTNDTHSCVMPLNVNLADTAVAGRGGYLRRIAMLKEERRRNPQLLLIDSGDFSQGSPYYTLFEGEVEVRLMNQMGYDAATIGNHEFDFGLDNMARLFRMAQFPIVCSNYDFTGTPVEGLVKRYVVIERQGLKIGLFGLCPQLDGLVDATKCQGVRYDDPVAVGNEMALMLKKKLKCDVVVCISHLGWDKDDVMGDPYFLARSRNVDLVLGGHSHTYFKELRYVTDLDGRQVPVDQNGKNAIYVGRLLLNFGKARAAK